MKDLLWSEWYWGSLSSCFCFSLASLPTRYGLVGPGIECWLWRDFLHLSIPALGLLSVLCNGYPVSLWGIKQQRRDAEHPLLPTAEVKERLKLLGLHELL